MEENKTLADNTTNAVVSENKMEEEKVTLSKKELDALHGKYGSALQKIRKLEEELVKIDELTQLLKQKEKEIETLQVYKQKVEENTKSQWNEIKDKIKALPEEKIKELFPEYDKVEDVEKMNEYITLWKKIQSAVAIFEKKEVPPKDTAKNRVITLKQGASNWRIG